MPPFLLLSLSLWINAISASLPEISEIHALIARHHLKPLDQQQMFESAASGILKQLDPHSELLNPEQWEQLKNSSAGTLVGVGIEVTVHDELIRVISPIDDSPASKAGIMPGDIITHVDGKWVADLGYMAAIERIRGQADTDVTLTIVRTGKPEPIQLTITRQSITTRAVRQRYFTPNIGYLRIASFDQTLVKQTQSAWEDLKSQHDIQSLIIDLRNNPGGLLEAAVQFADLFLDAKSLPSDATIVTIKGRDDRIIYQAHIAPGSLIPATTPVVVLINEGSASASEIVAAALQDHHRAIILGTNSFGKGSVQQVLPLSHGYAVKLTTSLYYSPNLSSIQGNGVQPDIVSPALHQHAKALLNPAFIKESDYTRSLTSQPSQSTNQAEDVSPDHDFQLYHAVRLLQYHPSP